MDGLVVARNGFHFVRLRLIPIQYTAYFCVELDVGDVEGNVEAVDEVEVLEEHFEAGAPDDDQLAFGSDI